MKKFLAILAAAALITSVFAAEPAANVGVAKFDGSASVKWGVDLDTNKTGFTNAETANFEFTLFAKGDKATASDADVWGEIKIEGGEVKNGASGSAAVKEAKLHVGPAYIGIRAGDVKVGGIDIVSATNSKNTKIGSVGQAETDGVTLGLNLDGVANFAVDFRSAQGYTNDYALAAEVDVKAVENLTLKAGVAIDLDSDVKLAAAATAAYEMALTDVFYIKPQVGYTYAASKNNVAFGLLFGWNKKEDQETNIYFVKKNVSNGVSAEATIIDSKIALNAGIWDSATLIENLTFGAEFNVADIKAADKGTVIVEAKYVAAVGEGKVTPKAGAEINLGTKVTAIKAGVECAGFVPFTTFSVDYATTDIANKKGTIDLTCKIAF
ncbi:MAG: hypothetical protein MJ183_10790 [Treponemataceae bacterium]|nr:hypothetical protein [Treponemataceae bacterium]